MGLNEPAFGRIDLVTDSSYSERASDASTLFLQRTAGDYTTNREKLWDEYFPEMRDGDSTLCSPLRKVRQDDVVGYEELLGIFTIFFGCCLISMLCTTSEIVYKMITTTKEAVKTVARGISRRVTRRPQVDHKGDQRQRYSQGPEINANIGMRPSQRVNTRSRNSTAASLNALSPLNE